MYIKLNTIEKIRKFCDQADKLPVDLYIRQGEYIVLARSIMSVFGLNLLEPIEVIIDELDINTEFLEEFKEV